MTDLKRSAPLLTLACLTMAGCSYDPPTSADERAGQVLVSQNGTLASALSSSDGMATVSDALKEAQLADLLDGVAAYTLLAPDDDAFTALGDEGETLLEPEQRAILVALLRDHLLVGHVTPDAIRSAIEDGGGQAAMATLGGTTVTFELEGDALAVIGPGGSRANIERPAIEAENGVALPLDGVLLPAAPRS